MVKVLPPLLHLYPYSRLGSIAGSSGRFDFGPVGTDGLATAESLPTTFVTGMLLEFSVKEYTEELWTYCIGAPRPLLPSMPRLATALPLPPWE